MNPSQSMEPSIESTALVATVIAPHQENDHFLVFRDFLHTHMAKYNNVRVLKNPSPEDPLGVTEYTFSFESTATADLSALRKSAREWAKSVNVDVAIQREDVFRRYKRLVVFDMDSTLIKQEVIDEIALEVDKTNPHKQVGLRVAVSRFIWC
jgi:hypothetical protein